MDTADLAGLSPSVRKLMIEHGLQSKDITGTGKDGKILRVDVQRYLEETPRAKKNIGLGQATPSLVLDKAPPAPKRELDASQKRVPMSQLRARVATRLKEVQNTAALLTTFNEVNMKPVMDMRP